MNYATDVSPVCFDLETAGLPNAADFLEPCQPDQRLTDPVKIQTSIRERNQARAEKFGLDWNVGRIVALGWWTQPDGLTVRACVNEDAEFLALKEFWAVARHRCMIGFRCKDFDLKFAIQRSRYLRVPYPVLDLGKYSRGTSIIDLYAELTFNDSQDRDSWCMRRTLHAFCKRFGIEVADDTSGADIARLVAEENWPAIVRHCSSDIQLTTSLAKRLGFVNAEITDEVAVL
jgi:hypothetical protein